MQIRAGWLADRDRLRLIIATATVLWGAFQALAALATGWGVLLLARLGLGVAEGPVFPASGKLNAVWLPARERGRGAVLIDGGAPLGTAFGGLIIALLIGVFGSWRTAFVVAGLGTIAAGLFAYWYIRDSPGSNRPRMRPRRSISKPSMRKRTRRSRRRRRGVPTSSAFFAFVPSWACCSAG